MLARGKVSAGRLDAHAPRVATARMESGIAMSFFIEPPIGDRPEELCNPRSRLELPAELPVERELAAAAQHERQADEEQDRRELRAARGPVPPVGHLD